MSLTDITRAHYNKLFDACTIDASRREEIDGICNQIVSHKATYQQIENTVGTPWYMIAVIHNRESSLNFNTHLHNGDPLSHQTVHVPAGRPAAGDPPFTFAESAEDALRYDKLDNLTDRTIANILYRLESFNGTGYQSHGINTPYLWAGSNQYHGGKFVADRVFDPDAQDKQIGCAALLLRLYERGDINLLGEPLTVTVHGATTHIPAFVLRGNSWLAVRSAVTSLGGSIPMAQTNPSKVTVTYRGVAKNFPTRVYGTMGYVDASDLCAFFGRSVSFDGATDTLAVG